VTTPVRRQTAGVDAPTVDLAFGGPGHWNQCL
jgi:hypothetical protein